MTAADDSAALRDAVHDAADAGRALQIVGGGSKAFLGRSPTGERLDVSGHCGVTSYEPTELVITARAGTPLEEVERTVNDRGQMLAFEPPYFGSTATLGGVIATGLSGPRRPFAGAARDFVLGVKIVNGMGEILSFGGQVMKNVAGYDVSRLMTGAYGTLGVLLEISLKVLPKPEHDVTISFEMTPDKAVRRLVELAGQTLPLSAGCWLAGQLHIRLSGTGAAVDAGMRKLGGDSGQASNLWEQVRELSHPCLSGEGVLWRLSVPAHAPWSNALDCRLVDWSGALRWVRSNEEPSAIREWTANEGGHATQFRDADRGGDVFHPLSPALSLLHGRLKSAFDPRGILNPGRFHRSS